jgi:hypothetical protein
MHSSDFFFYDPEVAHKAARKMQKEMRKDIEGISVRVSSLFAAELKDET